MDRQKESSAELAAGIVEEAERLVRLEIALAKQEAKELAIRNAIAGGLIATGGLMLMLGLLVAVPVLIVVLVPAHWIAALAWVALYLVGGGALVLGGRAGLRLKLPPRTINSLKETKEWALRQMRSPAR